MSKKNPSLVELQNTLGDLAESLRTAKLNTDDPEKVRAINHELIEVNHRITMAGSLIFHKQTAAVVAAAKKVESAKKDVEAEIKKLDELKTFIKSLSGFLGLADKVIDLAKLAIP